MKKLMRVMFLTILAVLAVADYNKTLNTENNIITSQSNHITETTEVDNITETYEKSLNLNIEEKGAGKFYLVNSTGTTENHNVIHEDLNGEYITMSQLGFECWDISPNKTAFIYLDGKLVKKLEVDDIQSTLTLQEEDLKEGKHIVEVLQFKEDANLSKDNIEFYEKAEYVIKNNIHPCSTVVTTNCNSENSDGKLDDIDYDRENAKELLNMWFSSSSLDD